jgi:hypothetical protein
LEDFGVPNFVADPELELFNIAGSSLATNDNWSGTDVLTTSADVGAFALDTGSLDAATLVDLPPGGYTVHVRSKGGSDGIALVEAYDASPSTGDERLISISTRGRVGSDSEIIIPGFIISSPDPRLVLIRGVGPSLAGHGVTGALSDPVLSVYAGNELIAQNNDWSTSSNSAEIAAEAVSTGAFALDENSKDAAMLLTLAPGTYTVHVSGVGDTSGIALCEVYVVE